MYKRSTYIYVYIRFSISPVEAAHSKVHVYTYSSRMHTRVLSPMHEVILHNPEGFRILSAYVQVLLVGVLLVAYILNT